MASSLEVKQYLAHWFQLGRKVYVRNGDLSLLPSRVFHGTHYSAEFERCWELMISEQAGDCYLEDTTQTISQLLTDEWDIVDCARCNMPISLPVAGVATESCPCKDLSHWPNNEVPAPISRQVVSSKLVDFQHRLNRHSTGNYADRESN